MFKRNINIPCRNVSKNDDGTWRYCNNPNCKYPHILSNLRVSCKYKECKKTDCKYKHHNETYEDFYKKLGKEVPLPEVLELPEHIMRRFKSKVCPNVIKIGDTWKTCNKKGCDLAHNIEELNIKDCYWGESCRQSNCRYKHNNETNLEVYNRGGLEIPVPIVP